MLTGVSVHHKPRQNAASCLLCTNGDIGGHMSTPGRLQPFNYLNESHNNYKGPSLKGSVTSHQLKGVEAMEARLLSFYNLNIEMFLRAQNCSELMPSLLSSLHELSCQAATETSARSSSVCTSLAKGPKSRPGAIPPVLQAQRSLLC